MTRCLYRYPSLSGCRGIQSLKPHKIDVPNRLI